MHGNLMYEMARQRIAEQRQTAQRAGTAREWRASARGRRARDEAAQAPVPPVIPDFADEMFDANKRAVPAPREESPRDGRARTSR
ncbi:MAG TPA: hypothetical protein VIZ43_05705 [Trebonia sp.]